MIKHIKIIKLKLVILLSIFTLFLTNIYAFEASDLVCKNAILMDNGSGKILFEKGGYEKVYPASTTKVLTAILALENLDLSTSTVVSETAVQLPYGSSNAALKQGEVMSIEDLLYALMLKSGNDCANVLAEAVSGTIENFVDLMNQKLEELDCTNSHFENAHGYHDDNHYTTPNDMMKILSYALKNETFVKITSTSSYTIKPTNKTSKERIYTNTNRLILTKDESYLSRYYEYCIGGKTGYTDEAGRTLVAYGTKEDKNLILGVFNSAASGIEDTRYTDAIELFEYGFKNFEKEKIITAEDYSFSYTDNENCLIYDYSLENDLYTLNDKNASGENVIVDYDITLDYEKLKQYDINSEDYKNQVIGSLNIKFRQNSLNYNRTLDLTLNSIDKAPSSSGFISILIKMLIAVLILYILFKLLKFFNKRSRKKNKKNKTKKTRRNHVRAKRDSLNTINSLKYRSR